MTFEEVKEMFKKSIDTTDTMNQAIENLIQSIYLKGYNDALNTVGDEQEPKTGHWSRKTKVDAYDIAGVKTWGIKCQCDRCDFTTIVVEDFGYYKYCPNCGADMRGDTE